jgi:hypothetical protein
VRKEYDPTRRLQDTAEATLLRLGGEPLLADVRCVAEAYVDRRLPWDGTGEEPRERLVLYGALLSRFAELLLRDRSAANPPPG